MTLHMIHFAGASLIVAALALHIAAAGWHFLWKRDVILQRMLPFTKV